MKQALAAQGFQGGTRGDTEWSQWVRSEKEQLSLVMERHGIEWEDKGTHDKHLSVLDYKKEQRATLDRRLERSRGIKKIRWRTITALNRTSPAVKNMDRLAAEFSANREEIIAEMEAGNKPGLPEKKLHDALLAQIEQGEWLQVSGI